MSALVDMRNIVQCAADDGWDMVQYLVKGCGLSRVLGSSSVMWLGCEIGPMAVSSSSDFGSCMTDFWFCVRLLIPSYRQRVRTGMCATATEIVGLLGTICAQSAEAGSGSLTPAAGATSSRRLSWTAPAWANASA